MRILERQFACVIAIGIAGATGQSAFAQGEPAQRDPAQGDPAQQGAPTPTDQTQSRSTPTTDEELCDPPASCAQPTPATPPPPAPEPQAMEPTPERMPQSTMQSGTTWIGRLGIGFSVGGGVDDFTSETMRGNTSTGGGWNARLTVGTKSYIAFEGSYIGSAQRLKALGVDDDAILLGNGLQGAVRVNVLTNFLVQPFLYGGIAWRRYDVTNTNVNTSAVADQDDVAEFPAGLGVSGYVGGLMADVRAEYRFATAEDLVPSRTDASSGATLDRWGVTGNVGFAY